MGTLNGIMNPPFIGMYPMIDVMVGISGLLKTSSPFMRDILKVIDDTKEIDLSVQLVAGSLKLLDDSLQANSAITSSGGTDLKHKCVFCELVSPMVATTETVLADSLGPALANAREEVKNQLTGPGGDDLAKTLEEGASPLTDVKNM